MRKAVGLRKRFDDPIVLPDGKKLSTPRDAINYLSEAVPKRDHKHPTAATILTNAAESRDFMMHARIAVLRATYRSKSGK